MDSVIIEPEISNRREETAANIDITRGAQLRFSPILCRQPPLEVQRLVRVVVQQGNGEVPDAQSPELYHGQERTSGHPKLVHIADDLDGEEELGYGEVLLTRVAAAAVTVAFSPTLIR